MTFENELVVASTLVKQADLPKGFLPTAALA